MTYMEKYEKGESQTALLEQRFKEILWAMKIDGLDDEMLTDIKLLIHIFENELSDEDKVPLNSLYEELKDKVEEYGL